ncbi:MAG: polyhydroxyalkanoate depolymerase, partial [Alphaproteobacteria bacterium]
MMYDAFDLQTDLAAQTRAWGRMLNDAWSPWIRWSEPARWMSANARMMMRTGLTFARPAYGIDSVTVGNRSVPVSEEAVTVTPFGTLLHFKKDIHTEQPKVLLVAPLSGHFATLLRATVRVMLPDHDVYITDWH